MKVSVRELESSERDVGEGSECEVAFGYINMPDDLPDRIRVVEQRLRDGARVCGWSLGEVFCEEMPGSSEAFERLQVALEHTSMRHVVIASFTHFSGHRLVQNLKLASLENDLAADVVALDEDLPLDQDLVPPAGGGARVRRYPCPWCAAQQTWPDGCSESIDAALDATDDGLAARCCISMIEKLCMLGDHRRCRTGACTFATRWHPSVREAGITATQQAGQAWAVVSTLGDTIDVVGTADELNQAKIVLRDVLSTAGYLGTPAGKGLVYVVRRSDGEFL